MLLLGICCHAQIITTPADETVKSLKSNGADSILVLTTDILGPTPYTYEDSFVCDMPYYLFWKENGKIFSQKLKLCRFENYKPEKTVHSSNVCLSSAPMYDFLARQLDSIADSDVAPLIYKRIYNGRESYEFGWKSHAANFRLRIYVGDTVIYKSVNPDYLEEFYGYPHLKNLNYAYNQSAAVWKFIELIDRKIQELEEKKVYILK